jgi:hypothetical protein
MHSYGNYTQRQSTQSESYEAHAEMYVCVFTCNATLQQYPYACFKTLSSEKNLEKVLNKDLDSIREVRLHAKDHRFEPKQWQRVYVLF